MDVLYFLSIFMTFMAMTGLVFAVAHLSLGRIRMRRRLNANVQSLVAHANFSGYGWGAFMARHFSEDRLGISPKTKQKRRLALIQAGYFSHGALHLYVLARIAAFVGAPSTILMTLIALQETFIPYGIFLVLVGTVVGALGPDAYLSRRRAKQLADYRINFPDLLDLLSVCVAAGLTVEAAFERIREPLAKRSKALGRNIELMCAEIRAGKSTVDALASLADRLALAEATSFVAVLRHSVELGGDISPTLREFSDDMRAKRILYAEQTANELPVKLVMPIAFGIFPVILMIVLLPVILKLLRVVGH
jgi:tight adherence protein C